MTAPINIDELRNLINEGEASDPLIFLESVMNGQDPRKTSAIYDLILEVDAFNTGDIPRSDWTEIVEHATSHSKYEEVTLAESITASKTVAEYLHAKRKQVDIVNADHLAGGAHSPLSIDEIELFKDTFNAEF